MAHSFSSISTFNNCPRQYYETRVLKLHPVIETEAMRWGTEVHKHCEEYVRDGAPLKETGIKNLQEALDAIRALPGGKNVELEMSFDRELTPVPFRSEQSWFNGIADVVVIDGDRALVLDYKTGGNKYPKVKQIELMALMVMLHVEEVNEVDGLLLFLVAGTATPGNFKREHLEQYKSYWVGEASKIEASEQAGMWPAKSSGLCPRCPCTTCEHHRPMPRRKT